MAAAAGAGGPSGSAAAAAPASTSTPSAGGTTPPPAAGGSSSWRSKLKPQTATGQKAAQGIKGDAKKYGRKITGISDPAGVMAAVLVYALVINGIRYGPAGITGWLKAKFLNRPMQGQAVNQLSPTGSGSKPPVAV